MNFIGKIRQNEKAVFLGKVIFFLPAADDSMDAFYAGKGFCSTGVYL